MRIMHTLFSRGFAGTERATAEMYNACVTQHEVTLVLQKQHRASNGVSIRDHLDDRVRVVEVSRWFPAWVARTRHPRSSTGDHPHPFA